MTGPTPARAIPGQRVMTAARARILELVQTSQSVCTVASLSDVTGLHPNTVRGHLEALVDHGSIQRRRVARGARGRPAWEYLPSRTQPEPDTRVRDYVGLAVALAGHLSATSSTPAVEAESAGLDWGRRMRSSAGAGTAETGAEVIVSLMADLGFAPEPQADGRTVRLLRCPLADAVREYPDVVCSVHRGLIRGVLEQGSHGAQGYELLPFAAEHACLVILPTSD